jgi:hypothetical protein
MSKGLRKTESLMPWNIIISLSPLAVAWTYWDTQADIRYIQGAQVVLERAVQEIQETRPGFPSGPIPIVVAPSPPAAQIMPAYEPATSRANLEIIKTTQRVEHTKLDVFCLAKNIFHEAGVEDRLGRYAVAQVTLNRMANPKYPKTVCDVVMDPYQFSWANDRSIRWTRPRGTNWNESVKIAENVLKKGYRVKGLESANYYHADYVSPRWRKPEAKIAKVGTHIFYASAR